mgnify:CR=1 FL=1
MEKLVIAGREFDSRLFLGTGKFNSNEVMEQSILASGTEMVTVAMKRIDMENPEDDMLAHVRRPEIQLLPNTSGARNAEEAVRIARLARQMLPEERYALMERFVGEYLAGHPAPEGDAEDNTTLAWLEYLREHGVEHNYATGSIAEVLADVNDRVSGQTQQLSNTLGWSKDILEMQLRQDSLRSQIGAQLDSLERDFGRMVAVAEHLPEISDRVLEEMNGQVTQLIWTMNASVEEAFGLFDRQRMALQGYVTQEREALIGQLRTTGEELVRSALDAVPGLVGRILLYVVLALAVLIGGPFALGFWLGGVRQRAKWKKEGNG